MPGKSIAFLLLSIAPAIAGEVPVDLKNGPGRELTENACSACHSLDYIGMNAPFLTTDQWKAEVTKMRKAYGAPIDDADADRIIRYLTVTYGAP
jgi:mono/diheme cytochrome c family protein